MTEVVNWSEAAGCPGLTAEPGRTTCSPAASDSPSARCQPRGPAAPPAAPREGHFAPQVPLRNPQKFPFTDVIIADEHLSDKLRELSAKMGVQHPKEDKQTTSHGTGAKKKLVSIFKDQPELIKRLLVLFKEDCDMYPEICDVSELYKAIAFEN